MAKKRGHAPQPQAQFVAAPPVAAHQMDAFRREVVALHQGIFRRNQQRINESVSGYTAAFRRYERTHAQGVKAFSREATLDEMERDIARAEVVYVGDYHTLAQSQRAFLRLLRRLDPRRPVILALEFVQGRYQRALDNFMAGTTNESEFLRAIKHSDRGGFGAWSAFKPLFAHAREHGMRVIGIDSIESGPKSLTKRDAYAANRIAQAAEQHPDALVMVLVGQLHIAPAHLPRAVGRKSVIIHQNCENIYAALVQKGREHDVELVKIRANEYCLINTPPIVCQQSFLNWLYAEEDGEQIEAPEQTFVEYVRLIADFFQLPLGDALDHVELTTVVDLSFLERLRRRGDFSRHDMATIKQQILHSESYYIPRAKMVYLGNLSVNHVSEEATHFLRHVCADLEDPKLLVDAFYARCIEEALGFLGSKVINHKRKRPGLQYFRRLRTSKSANPRDKLMAKLVLRHASMETGKRTRGMSEVYECDADMFNAITHILGYRLGDRVYYALLQGILQKDEIREQFLDSFEEEGSALSTYLYLISRTANVKSPTRF